jgi:hypothetical protein
MTVTVKVPSDALLLAVKVRILVLVVLPGLNEALTPFEKPEADRLTLPPNPFSELTVMVLVPLPPRRMLRLLGDAERLKSGCGAGLTVRLIGVVCVVLPLVPVIVSG